MLKPQSQDWPSHRLELTVVEMSLQASASCQDDSLSVSDVCQIQRQHPTSLTTTAALSRSEDGGDAGAVTGSVSNSGGEQPLF